MIEITDQTFKRDIKKAQKRVERAAKNATKQTMDKRVQLSFDNTEVIPSQFGTTGTIIVSGTEENISAIEEALKQETQSLITETLEYLTKEIGGMLK